MTGQAGDVEVRPAGPEDAPSAPDQEPAPATNDGSVAGQLRARFRALQDEHHVDVDVPGFNGLLVGRYGLMPQDRIEARAKAIERVPKAQQPLTASMDLIIESCISLWFREDEVLRPLDADDDTIRYDHRLANVLGITVDANTTARDILRRVFTVNGTLNTAAIMSHANEIGAWMENVSREVGEKYVGESRAATRS